MLVPPRHTLGGGGTLRRTVGAGGARGTRLGLGEHQGTHSGVGGTEAHIRGWGAPRLTLGGGGHRGSHLGRGQAACIIAGGKYGSSIRKAPVRHWLALGPVLGGCHLAARPMCPL